MDVDWVDIATGVVLFIVGVGVGAFVVAEFPAVQERTQTYQQTPGEIVQSSVVAIDTDNDGRTEYRPVVRYQYDVDGETYQSTRVQLDGSDTIDTEQKQRATRIAAQHTVNGSVTVSYATENPTNAFLSHNGTTYVGIIIATLLSLFLTISGINTFRLGLQGEERPQLSRRKDD